MPLNRNSLFKGLTITGIALLCFTKVAYAQRICGSEHCIDVIGVKKNGVATFTINGGKSLPDQYYNVRGQSGDQFENEMTQTVSLPIAGHISIQMCRRGGPLQPSSCGGGTQSI